MSEITSKSPDALERDIQRTQLDIAETLNALEKKVSARTVLDNLFSGASTPGSEFAGNLGRTVRDNPLPITLIGAGLAWLMVAPRTNGRDAADYVGGVYTDRADPSRVPPGSPAGYRERAGAARARGEAAMRSARARGEQAEAGLRAGLERTANDMGERTEAAAAATSAAAGRAQGQAHTAAHGARDRMAGAHARTREAMARARAGAADAYGRAGGAGHRAYDRARGLSDDVYRRGSSMAYRARARAGDLGDEAGAFVREHPLVTAAFLAAAGGALASLLPRSRREDAWMGEHSDALKAAAMEAARRESEHARDVVTAAAEGARREAERRGMTPDAAREVAMDAARRAIRETTDVSSDVAVAALREGEAAAKRRDAGDTTGSATGPRGDGGTPAVKDLPDTAAPPVVTGNEEKDLLRSGRETST